MNASLAATLGRLLILSVPLGTLMILSLLSLLPYGTLGAYSFTPNLGYAGMVYWTLRRPDLLPPLSVFLAGIALDVMGSGPVGLWALAFLSGYAFLLWQRVLFVGRAALPSLLGAGLAILIGFSAGWGAASWQAGLLVAPWPVAVHGLLTLVAFPLVGVPLSRIEARLPEPD
ncbi:MAG: hypothetical protein HXY25_06310 [Alphaproteobacteria bacterium]|nr:hypothetical protein [Alphaproteobacteria bacterium]